MQTPHAKSTCTSSFFHPFLISILSLVEQGIFNVDLGQAEFTLWRLPCTQASFQRFHVFSLHLLALLNYLNRCRPSHHQWLPRCGSHTGLPHKTKWLQEQKMVRPSVCLIILCHWDGDFLIGIKIIRLPVLNEPATPTLRHLLGLRQR